MQLYQVLWCSSQLLTPLERSPVGLQPKHLINPWQGEVLLWYAVIDIDKQFKSLALAVAAFPVGLAIAALLEKFGVVDPQAAHSWALLKLIVSVTCGLAYFLGLRLFNEAGSKNDK